MEKIIMADSINILESLVLLSKPLTEISDELSKLDWDYKAESYVVLAKRVSSVLHRYVSGELSSDDVEGWANLIECREDLEFESSKEKELENTIYRLANPVLEGEITPELCRQLISKLS